MTQAALDAIRQALLECSPEERRRVFNDLRAEFSIHQLEADLNTTAEVILGAIARGGALTLRGIRGIIAETYFHLNVVIPLASSGWSDVTGAGDLPFDFELQDKVGSVRVQVKNQRLEGGKPKLWRRANSNAPTYVAETQRTRTGKSADGSATRPYRFGEFDLLAVCLHPSTGNWGDFRYTVARWLLPRDGGDLIKVMQPVSSVPNDDWTDNFLTAAGWFRSAGNKTIWS